MVEALLAGVAAGYAIAIPVGPIAILIFQTAVRRGFGTASSAALGAASADGLYATLAGLLGASLVTVIAPVVGPARILGAAALAFIGLRGLVEARRPDREQRRQLTGRPLTTYLLLLGLTVTNPMTFLYFAALMIGLPVVSGGIAERLAFAAGAFAASASWQLLLAGSGSLLHGRLPAGFELATRIIGSLVILGFALAIGLQAVTG